MKTSEKVDIIFSKLDQALNELDSVKKSSENPFFKSRYADLNAHLDVAGKALKSQGLRILQPVCRDERGSYVETTIIDPKSGQFVVSAMDLILAKPDMQNMGSAVTYARRYTLGALLAMQAEDDDGNQATFGKTTQTTSEAPKARSSFRKAKANGSGPAPLEGVTTSETTEEWS